MKYKCLYEYLEEEGYGKAKIKKICDAYFYKKTHLLKGYELRSLNTWIIEEATKGVNIETNNNKN